SGFFGSCQAPVISSSDYKDPQEDNKFLKAGESVPGECITGGRTGYSVKIISKDFLFSNMKASGLNGGESTILNPPDGF
ncbi:MAG: hypothetical protein L6Q37_02320, partial [Bdellovibrionaceae bacterium]|nr:hypothetical protein [Pseudobdellovibrionaceae bacterium]